MALDAEGLGDDIQVYSLHPGGVPTDLGSCTSYLIWTNI
jgi:hypothetical protein